MTYDPEKRFDTPLALKLKDEIQSLGPIGLEKYIVACLLDPFLGYYRTKDAIGRSGDFITAPEISQVFGELLGLWCAVVWQQMGSPLHVNLIELGPGRGTLMADALRAARLKPEFLKAIEVHLVEASDVLREKQRSRLAQFDVPVRWHDTLAQVPPAPAIVIANEFLDALAMSQWRWQNGAWYKVMVGFNARGVLDFVLGERGSPAAGPVSRFLKPEEGDVLELKQYSELICALANRSRTHPVAALFLDYGHTDHQYGDTLQGVRAHSFEHPLSSPGQADLSNQVDFAALLGDVTAQGLRAQGPITQCEFLTALGIMERTSRLMSTNPGKAATVEAGVARLMAPSGMGTRFKVMGVRSPQLPELPGLTVAALAQCKTRFKADNRSGV